MNLTKLIKTLFGFNSPEYLGARGETLVSYEIDKARAKGCNGFLLRNVYFPKVTGNLTEADLVFITQRGLFIIESKNYSGYIFGHEKNKNWVVTLYGGKNFLGSNEVEKYNFYNPIWQNNAHIKALRMYYNRNYRAYSIVVFSDRCVFKSITVESPDVYICHKSELHKLISTIWENEEPIYLQNEIDYLFNDMKRLTELSEKEKKEHIQKIKSNMNSDEKCPRCGGKLVKRMAQKGNNAGNLFYGCSNFPKCKFTKNITNHKL